MTMSAMRVRSSFMKATLSESLGGWTGATEESQEWDGLNVIISGFLKEDVLADSSPVYARAPAGARPQWMKQMQDPWPPDGAVSSLAQTPTRTPQQMLCLIPQHFLAPPLSDQLCGSSGRSLSQPSIQSPFDSSGNRLFIAIKENNDENLSGK